jgi:hypothetical protein
METGIDPETSHWLQAETAGWHHLQPWRLLCRHLTVPKGIRQTSPSLWRFCSKCSPPRGTEVCSISMSTWPQRSAKELGRRCCSERGRGARKLLGSDVRACLHRALLLSWQESKTDTRESHGSLEKIRLLISTFRLTLLHRFFFVRNLHCSGMLVATDMLLYRESFFCRYFCVTHLTVKIVTVAWKYNISNLNYNLLLMTRFRWLCFRYRDKI